MKLALIKTRKLKDPHLRKLRESLRTILLIALKLEQKRLRFTKLIYTERRSRRGLTPSQAKRCKSLNMTSTKLAHAKKFTPLCCTYGVHCRSKLKSGIIDSTDLDLIWIPYRLCWMCLPCYFDIYLKTENITPILGS